MKIPDSLIKNILALSKDQGKQWLDQLKPTLDELSQAWYLTNVRPLRDMFYSFLVQADHPVYGSIVCKIVYAQKDFDHEVAALKAYAGSGSVEIYDFDVSRKALLLECLEPGRSAATLFSHNNDEAATHHLITIIKQLKKVPCETSTRSLSNWFAPLRDYTYPEIAAEHSTLARGLVQDLITCTDTTLAHGDLHHANIIESQRGWLSIDPKGVCAPYGYDVSTYMYNPLTLLNEKNCRTIIGRRLDQCADGLSLDCRFLATMSYCQALLATCWALQAGAPWEHFYHSALLIKEHI